MRCNPWRWLWGLIPVAMLSWITYHWERGTIEADLRQRASQELGRQGFDWAETEFSGRDAILRGRAAEEAEPKRAFETVRDMWGVRVVNQRTDLMPKPDVYGWLASLDKGKLVLSGHVPSEAARRSLLSVAKANFPKASIDDAMQLARGAPPLETWMGGTSFALRQLAQLRRGSADLSGTSLTLAGEAADAASYKSVNTALTRLPNGIKLGGKNVTPAVASPFVWSAKRAEDKLVLSGHVPSDKVREDVFALAKSRFGKITVVDRMEVAGGEPDGWSRTANLALEQLAQLDDGSAETRSAQLTITGMAPDQSTADAIRKLLRMQVPATFKWAETIKHRAPVVPVIDYEAQWREAEARWAAQEAARERSSPPVDDGEPWWRIAQREAEAKRLAGEEAARRWADENKHALLSAEEERQRAEAEARRLDDERRRAEDDAARQRAEAEARRKAEEEAARLRLEEDKRRQSDSVAREQRKAEADKCQTMMREAASQGRILFRTNSAELDLKSAPTLLELAKIANACLTARIEIAGHTDSDGGDDFNKSLSERRAQSIVTFLTKAGLDAGRLKAVGYGEERPVAPNDSAANKAKNRRIEFTVDAN